MKVKFGIVACAIAACFLCVLALHTPAKADDPPPAISRQYDIERQVDAVRYVSTAIMRNNRHGDWFLEFTAERTDLPDTREWWTLRFENDPSFDHLTHLEVDGSPIYSEAVFDDGGTLKLSLSTQTQSAVLVIGDACGSPDIGTFDAIVAATQAYSGVVTEVLSVIIEVLVTEEQGSGGGCTPSMPAFYDCVANNCGSGLPPGNSPMCQNDQFECDHPDECCEKQFDCCRDRAKWYQCYHETSEQSETQMAYLQNLSMFRTGGTPVPPLFRVPTITVAAITCALRKAMHSAKRTRRSCIGRSFASASIS